MLLDSATKHERARCARMWEEEGFDKKSRLVERNLLCKNYALHFPAGSTETFLTGHSHEDDGRLFPDVKPKSCCSVQDQANDAVSGRERGDEMGVCAMPQREIHLGSLMREERDPDAFATEQQAVAFAEP